MVANPDSTATPTLKIIQHFLLKNQNKKSLSIMKMKVTIVRHKSCL